MAVEVAKHGLGLLEIQEMISKNGGSEHVQKYTCVLKMKIINFLDKMITIVFKRVKSASGRAPYIVLTGRWFGITILNVHAHSENKSDDSVSRFYEELEEAFFHLLKYRIKFCY
jgi:hypothetical protein